jgi:hypothetical protein
MLAETCKHVFIFLYSTGYTSVTSSVKDRDVFLTKIFERISKKYGVRVWTGSIWLRIETSGGLF